MGKCLAESVSPYNKLLEMNDLSTLRALVFDSLNDEIALIDDTGIIVDVNLAWTNFGFENGLNSECACVGRNYLDALSASVARGDYFSTKVERGICEVLRGSRERFSLEYPCHSPKEKRWFMMHIASLKDRSTGIYVISHYNITQRKLAEERAEYLAMNDPLTGLANRRRFNEFLNTEMRRSIRKRTPLSLIMLDIDYFKNYNDRFGHREGDHCLTQISRILLAYSRRPADLAARFGGDEFALILGQSNREEAQTISTAILSAIYDLDLVIGESRRVTASIGVASLTPRKLQEADLLVRETDKALYRAKAEGRNRIVFVQVVNTDR